MGLTGYYRCFIANFSKNVKPLTSLTQKNKKYEWGVEQEEYFQTLKDNLFNAPILSLPDGAKDFVVCCDASNQGLGCKANVVADALSRKERVKSKQMRAMSMKIQSSIKQKLLAAQNEATKEENAPAEILRGLDQQMEKKGDGGLYFMDRIWVPLIGDVRTMIMDEAYTTRYSIHLGVNKMYYDLRDMYWWPGTKKDITTYVSKCLTCSKVKAEHQRPSGLLQQPEIPEWKWDKITMDFITKLPSLEKLSRLYIDKILVRHEVPVSIISDRDGRFTSRLWQTLQKALGTRFDMRTAYHPQTDGQSECTIQTLEDMLIIIRVFDVLHLKRCMEESETTDKVALSKERLKAARDRQKSYVDNRCKPLEFEVGSFEILERIDPVAYRLRLPQELSNLHDTCHVSNLKKCLANANLHVPLEEIRVDKTLHFVEEPEEIMDRKVKKLKRSRILIVKVCWNSKRRPEFTWEHEDFM
ncbi:putative reverse transcriptase domain-containing protein [Tanacetum coccineum]